jgi:hypothetical protein
VARQDGDDAEMEWCDSPEMLPIFEKLGGKAGIGEARGTITVDRKDKKNQEDGVR